MIQSSGRDVHHLVSAFCTAAAVENYGGSLQNVVVPASLHSSVLEAFDLFTASGVRVCFTFSHNPNSPAVVTEIGFSWLQGSSRPVKCVCWLWEFVDHMVETEKRQMKQREEEQRCQMLKVVSTQWAGTCQSYTSSVFFISYLFAFCPNLTSTSLNVSSEEFFFLTIFFS